MMFGSPLSRRWGLDRGGLPPHRHYVNIFLEECSSDIQGRCLEFDDRNYTQRYGGPDVACSDVLHLDHSNPKATVVADITKPNAIPDNTYDCIVCTYVLHVIEDVGPAIACMHRILRPGGVLLCAVPAIMGASEEFGDLWRFTRLGLRHALLPAFGDPNINVRAYGSSIVAAGEMRGMLADEFTSQELHAHDPMFGIVVCARALKAA